MPGEPKLPRVVMLPAKLAVTTPPFPPPPALPPTLALAPKLKLALADLELSASLTDAVLPPAPPPPPMLWAVRPEELLPVVRMLPLA